MQIFKTGNRVPLSVVALAAAVSLLATACVRSETSDASGAISEEQITTTATTATAATATTAATAEASSASVDTTTTVDETITTMLNNLAVLYRSSAGVWPGFDPADHPTIVGLRDGSAVTSAVAVNHPDPAALGNATLIDTGDAPFTAHYIAELSDQNAFDDIDFFDFNSQQGGVDSFVMVADPSDELFTADAPEFATTYIHEMFHRYQFANFNETLSQDFENYPYTAKNLELAALEGRALTAALQAESDAGRDEAARRFVAIRLARRAAFPEVIALDDSQEIAEGSARFIEHLVATEDFGATYHRDNVDGGEIPTDVSAQYGVKETFGFGRFYATGAAILELLDRIDAPNYTDRVESNDAPATILADVLGVTDEDVTDLVAEAKAEYDPLKQLANQAAEGAEIAKDEPPIFDDAPSG